MDKFFGQSSSNHFNKLFLKNNQSFHTTKEHKKISENNNNVFERIRSKFEKAKGKPLTSCAFLEVVLK